MPPWPPALPSPSSIPLAGNLGGGGFLLLRLHDGRSTFIDYREKAPLAATETMYQDAKGNIIPDASIVGYRAIATPGSVAGLAYAERKYGKLGLERVMAPGHPPCLRGIRPHRRKKPQSCTTPSWPSFPIRAASSSAMATSTRPAKHFASRNWRSTLQRIAADPDDFYHGKMAQELVDDLKKGGALITLEDLAQYNVVERKPIIGTYHNYTIISAPPPSSGGVVLLSALNILEGYDLKSLGDRTPASMHLITEAYRRAYMDRADYLGDPDYNHIPVAALTVKEIRRRVARRHPAAQGHAQRGPASAPPDSCRPRPRPPAVAAPSRRTPPTTPSSTAKATPSPSPPPSTTPSAPASPPARSASCSTTRWTTSRRRWACPTCSASSKGRPTPSRRASARSAP